MAYRDSHLHRHRPQQGFCFELSRQIYEIKSSTVRRLTPRLYELVRSLPGGQATRRSPLRVNQFITANLHRRGSRQDHVICARWVLEHLLDLRHQ